MFLANAIFVDNALCFGEGLKDSFAKISGSFSKIFAHKNDKKDSTDSGKEVQKKTASKVVNNKKIYKEYIVRVKPPDSEIFKKILIDITAKRPNVYRQENLYVVDNLFIFENTGDGAKESKTISFRNALDLGFSNLVLDSSSADLDFTMADAFDCFYSFEIVQEYFDGNDYLGNFTLYFNADRFDLLKKLKMRELFLKGFNEKGYPIFTMITNFKFNDVSDVSDVEDLLKYSGIRYKMLAIKNGLAVIKLFGDGKNIMEKITKYNLDIEFNKNMYYLFIKN